MHIKSHFIKHSSKRLRSFSENSSDTVLKNLKVRKLKFSPVVRSENLYVKMKQFPIFTIFVKGRTRKAKSNSLSFLQRKLKQFTLQPSNSCLKEAPDDMYVCVSICMHLCMKMCAPIYVSKYI